MVELSFDLEYFDPAALTVGYVDRVVRNRLGGEGISIRVEEVRA
jgi:hypothetical protein